MWYLFVALWGVILIHEVWVRMTQIKEIPYSQFQTYLGAGRVQGQDLPDKMQRCRDQCQQGQPVGAQQPAGPTTTRLSVSMPHGWLPGEYKLEFILNNKAVGLKTFAVN